MGGKLEPSGSLPLAFSCVGCPEAEGKMLRTSVTRVQWSFVLSLGWYQLVRLGGVTCLG